MERAVVRLNSARNPARCLNCTNGPKLGQETSGSRRVTAAVEVRLQKPGERRRLDECVGRGRRGYVPLPITGSGCPPKASRAAKPARALSVQK